MCCQQFVWQMIDLLNPISHFHFMMNVGYISNTFICMAIFLYSFKDNVNPKVTIIPMLLLTTQQEIRLLDLENTRSIFADNPLGFDFFIIFITISCTVLILIIAQNYNIAGITIFQYLQVMVILYIYGLNENQTLKSYYEHLFNIFTLAAFLMVYLYLHRHWVEKFQILIGDSIDAQSLFQNIFDNSEDSIIIITDEKVEYINETFLTQYQVFFDSFVDQIIQSHENKKSTERRNCCLIKFEELKNTINKFLKRNDESA